MDELSPSQQAAVKEAANEIVVGWFRDFFKASNDQMTPTNAFDYWCQNEVGMTYNEIADLRGVSYDSVNKSLMRAREALHSE